MFSVRIRKLKSILDSKMKNEYLIIVYKYYGVTYFDNTALMIKNRSRWDSNPQPLDPKSNALSIAPHDRDLKNTHLFTIRRKQTEHVTKLIPFRILDSDDLVL